MFDLISYDDSNMFRSAIGKGGLPAADVAKLLTHLRDVPHAPFMDLPYQRAEIGELERIAKRVRRQFKKLLVVGIGGSSNAARAFYQALYEGKGMELIFVPDPDPEVVAPLLKKTDWKQTAVLVVSKSGTNLEPVTLMLIIRQSLIKAIGIERHAEHLFVLTEPIEENPLFVYARAMRYAILPHPTRVGGRFSALTATGLFPAACAGINIRKIIAGAKQAQEDCDKKGSESLPARFAALHVLASKSGHNTHVLMPYASRLEAFGQWYRQLWAESLGKSVHPPIGPTPIVSPAPSDQHSQLQLYNEGPNDKVVTFLVPRAYRDNVRVRTDVLTPPAFRFLHKRTMQEIMHAEYEGVRHALCVHGRMNATLEIPSINETTMGALCVFFQMATVYFAHAMGIDPYNQPGVEEGKAKTRRALTS